MWQEEHAPITPDPPFPTAESNMVLVDRSSDWVNDLEDAHVEWRVDGRGRRTFGCTNANRTDRLGHYEGDTFVYETPADRASAWQ
jgi:hypothetical protein